VLILSRKLGQSIRIGDKISVSIEEIRGKQIKIGVFAPDDISVHREEIFQDMLSKGEQFVPVETPLMSLHKKQHTSLPPTVDDSIPF
jgi:carbon storage regulator